MSLEASRSSSVAICAEPPSQRERVWHVHDYDLDSTLDCGQAFNWRRHGDEWRGVVSGRWVELASRPGEIIACTIESQRDWLWLEEYLQLRVNLAEVFAEFPADDPHLEQAIKTCRGMRLLKQDYWECLASFILSSTKQIVQIQQITNLLRSRYGERVKVPDGYGDAFIFPQAEKIMSLTETDLRGCKMGFRAPYLLDAARKVTSGEVDLKRIATLPLVDAQAELMKINGVGEKIAECVLLYGYGFPTAFPVDVWVARALSEFYFKGPKVALPKLRRFAAKHFGCQAGYAQQYLFQHIRMRKKRMKASET